MVLGRLGAIFAPRATTLAGRKLFVAVSAQARNPDLYRLGGAPDTPEGRFEVLSLHVVLVLHRLKGHGPQSAETAQVLFDTFLNNLDEGLRDMGVGDLSVGKKMRKLGEAIYGRVKGLDAALATLPDRTALSALIGRTVFGNAAPSNVAAPGRTSSGPDAMTAYVADAEARLSAQTLDQVLEAQLSWPPVAHAPC